MAVDLDAQPQNGNDALMAHGALYFPYIEVPDRPELARVLLYWDELGTIVPDSFAQRGLGPRTRDLVSAGLVRPIDPRDYYDELDGFGREFIGLVEGLGLQRGTGLDPVMIHREKVLSALWRELVGRGLARQSSDWAWMEVHPAVAALFMAYLAGRLGRTPALDMFPITDQSAYFRAVAPNRAMDTAAVFDQLRGVVLSDVLPAPREPIDVRALAAFKEANWEVLGGFRRYVESRILECARERDLELRRLMVAQVREELVSRVDEIARRLAERRWTPAVGVVCTAVAAAPAVAETVITGNPFPVSSAAAAPLAEVVRRALTGGRPIPADEPLAFAALAQRTFG